MERAEPWGLVERRWAVHEVGVSSRSALGVHADARGVGEDHPHPLAMVVVTLVILSERQCRAVAERGRSATSGA